MNNELVKFVSMLGLGIIVITMLVLIGMNTSNIYHNLNLAIQDLNTLKNNDIGFANYIQSNATTLQYINENCKITQDNNDVTILTCIKPKGN